ncbi:MAG: putative methyltransferase [Methylophagaceae bacterium]|jgi:predicted methyltransferase
MGCRQHCRSETLSQRVLTKIQQLVTISVAWSLCQYVNSAFKVNMMYLFNRNKVVLFVLLMILFSTSALVQAHESLKLLEIINGEQRSELNRQRNIYRHPLQTLDFFQIKSEMTVVEIWPGEGWYTEILAPYLKNGGGHFIAAGFPKHAGPQWRQDMQADYQSWLIASPELYNEVKVVELGPPSYWSIGPVDSVDAVLTFRNVS